MQIYRLKIYCLLCMIFSVALQARPDIVVGARLGLADVDFSSYEHSNAYGIQLGVRPHAQVEFQLQHLIFPQFELDNSLSAYIEGDMTGLNLSLHSPLYDLVSAAFSVGYYRWQGEAHALSQKIGEEDGSSGMFGVAIYLQPASFIRFGINIDQIQQMFGEQVRLGHLSVEYLY
jgi:hypothetical protein